jgi:hypothetical protein
MNANLLGKLGATTGVITLSSDSGGYASGNLIDGSLTILINSTVGTTVSGKASVLADLKSATVKAGLYYRMITRAVTIVCTETDPSVAVIFLFKKHKIY